MRTAYQELDKMAIERVKLYLFEHSHESFDVAKVASLVCFSVSKLNKTFKRYEGCGPASYHRKLKIRLAQEMACEQEVNWTLIGYQLGYADLPSFSKAFKRVTGISPRQFRSSVI